MAERKTKRLRPIDLQADIDSYAGLEGLTDYDPANADYDLTKGAAAKAAMQGKQSQEVKDYGTYQASRDQSVEAEWVFHDYVRNARIQVKAQYGESSDELQKVGLKKKSEYKNPTKRQKDPVIE